MITCDTCIHKLKAMTEDPCTDCQDTVDDATEQIGFRVVYHNYEDALATCEAITWHDANKSKPDADMTVLCWGSEGFFCGYWDDEINGWIGCESGGSVLGVTHWSIPDGPANAKLTGSGTESG